MEYKKYNFDKMLPLLRCNFHCKTSLWQFHMKLRLLLHDLKHWPIVVIFWNKYNTFLVVSGLTVLCCYRIL